MGAFINNSIIVRVKVVSCSLSVACVWLKGSQSLFQSTGNPPTQTGTSTSAHITTCTSNTSVRLPEPYVYSIGPTLYHPQIKISETQRVITKLNANRYPTSFINSCQPRTHHNNRPPGDKNTKRDFVVLPCNTRGFSEKIARLLGKHNIKLRYRTSPSALSHHFLRNRKTHSAKKGATGVVYKINCNSCSAVYIGQTSHAFNKNEKARTLQSHCHPRSELPFSQTHATDRT